MPLTPEAILNGRYRIISILGQGGMGAVYRAEDIHLHTPIAVKENLFLTSEYSRQFEREATIMARLRHPHLPRVRDFFDNPGQGQYLVMDFIEGDDIRQRLSHQNITEEEAIAIGVAVCTALAYLHSRTPPVVHRDIKPGNVKITPSGQVFLVDFGLAKESKPGQATTTGARAMTPGYSPPEQYGTARTDSRSDIYSLGATLYAALTGKIPEDGLTRATEKANLTPIRRHVPRVNSELAEIIQRALEIDPEDRYQSAGEMRHDLLEAGELTSLLFTPPTISAPPDFSIPPVEDLLNGEPSNNNIVKPSTSRNTRRRFTRIWKRNRVAILSTASVFITIILLLFALKPGSTPPIIASEASPTTTKAGAKGAWLSASSPICSGANSRPLHSAMG